MIQRLQNILISLALVIGVGALTVAPAHAINVIDSACKGSNNSTTVCKAKNDSADALIQNIIGLLLWAVGLISVLMIIVGSIRYSLSGGDASATKSARETIIYAVVGLIVALLAFAIVKFVVGWF